MAPRLPEPGTGHSSPRPVVRGEYIPGQWIPTAAVPREGAATERERVLALLQRHGWNSTSFQILEPGFRYWFDGDDACVAYVDTGRAWVAAGRADCAARAARRGRRGASSTPRAPRTGARRVSGSRPLRATHDLAASLRDRRPAGVGSRRPGGRSSRQPQPARAAAARARQGRDGARGRPRPSWPPNIRRGVQVDTLIARWLASRPIAPMGFLVQVHPFTFRAERRYFVAERDGQVVAFLGMVPIYARRGWFFEDFLRDPDAPNGTVELLVDAAMRAAAAEGAPRVTLGLAPLAGDVGAWLRAARRLGRALYDFDGLRAFKAKFQPSAWDPDLPVVSARGKARSPRCSTRWRRSRAAACSGSASRPCCAAPRWWSAGSRRCSRCGPWSSRSRRARTSFRRRRASTAGSGSTSPSGSACSRSRTAGASRSPTSSRSRSPLDAAITILQAIVYDLPRRTGALDVLVVAIAILAPTIASVLLWNARAHREQGT